MSSQATLAVPRVIPLPQVQEGKDIPPLVLFQADPLAGAIQQQTGDLVCRALALECDRLEQILQYSIKRKLYKVGELAAAIARRVATLRCLGDRLDIIQEREEAPIEIAAMAKVVRMAKDVLRESGLPAETREMIFQSLIERISVNQTESGK
jgi:hypothetical protein